MTLILSLLTPTYVLQVSDRRVSRSEAGRVVWFDDDRNKALFYCERAAFGYTGVAEIAGQRTDHWLAHVLGDCRTLSEAFDQVKLAATQAFAKPNMNGQRLAVAGVGWSQEADGKSLPFYGVLSNYLTRGNPRKVGNFTIEGIKMRPPRSNMVWAAGQKLLRAEAIELLPIVRQMVNHGVSHKAVIDALGNLVRRVAKREESVGSSLMATYIPRSAADSPLAYAFIFRGASHPDAATFYDFPSDSTRAVSYWPNFSCDGSVMIDKKWVKGAPEPAERDMGVRLPMLDMYQARLLQHAVQVILPNIPIQIEASEGSAGAMKLSVHLPETVPPGLFTPMDLVQTVRAALRSIGIDYEPTDLA